VVVGTTARGGQALTKHFKVYTNDPKQAQVDLVVTGKVAAYVEVSPSRVNLVGRAGDQLSREVRITPGKGFPFTIKEAKAKTGQHIRLDLKPLDKNVAESGYLLTVTNTKKDPGSFGDYIEIQTDLKEKPTFGIPVTGRIHGEPAKPK